MKVEVAARRDRPAGKPGPLSDSPAPSGLRGFYQQFCPIESWRPPVNLYETDACFLVCVDLAGMDREAIDVSVRDNVLVVSGTREHPQPAWPNAGMSIHLMEIDQGPFCRSVEIPAEVDVPAIRASYTTAGYLWIELPKRTARPAAPAGPGPDGR